jgi:hypothetical protein
MNGCWQCGTKTTHKIGTPIRSPMIAGWIVGNTRSIHETKEKCEPSLRALVSVIGLQGINLPIKCMHPSQQVKSITRTIGVNSPSPDTNSQVFRVQNRLFNPSQRLNGQNSYQQKRPNNLCASRASVRSGSSALWFLDMKAPHLRGFFRG